MKTKDKSDYVDILVLIASHNRRDKTLAALETLFMSSESAGTTLHVVLADASSTDGTPEAVKDQFPSVRILSLDADHYWAGSMRKAWESSAHVERHYEMWLNDDVVLFEESLSTLLDVSRDYGDFAVVIGSTSDPATGQLTYGGQKRGPWWDFLKATPINPSDKPITAHLGNGNILLYSKKVSTALGGFPSGFTHAMADTYFVWKAQRTKVPALVAPGFLGHCQENEVTGTWRDAKLSRGERFKLVNSPKGLRFGEWTRICFSIGGLLGIRYILSPYLRIIARL